MMKLLNWLMGKIKIIRQHRLEVKVLPLFQKLMHLRYNTVTVNIKDYLKYETYSFDDDYRYKKPNESCSFMIVVTDNHELIFLKRTFTGEWLKVTYHTNQLYRVMTHKLNIIAIARKIRNLNKS